MDPDIATIVTAVILVLVLVYMAKPQPPRWWNGDDDPDKM
jgi:hypothetical protein